MILSGSARLQPGSYYHTRGYLPHLEFPETIQHVTYHLADSLPKEALVRMEEERRYQQENQKCLAGDGRTTGDCQAGDGITGGDCQAGAWRAWDEYLAAGYGSCVLREPVIAEMVQKAFLHFDGERYRLFAWVVMPNHVHVLFQPLADWSVSKIVASWKSFTGRRIAEFVRARGEGSREGRSHEGLYQAGVWQADRIWHREYWDRFIRNQRHFEIVVHYIHENPVKAWLVAKAEDWLWSSARSLG